MIDNRTVTVVTYVATEKQAEHSLPLVSAACSSLVDELLVFVPETDKALVGLAWQLVSESICPVRVLTFNGKAGQICPPGLFHAVEIPDTGILVWMSADVCYVHSSAVTNLASHVAGRSEVAFAFPACVATERTTYIQQAMGSLPPWCVKQWDGLYIDYLDMRKEHSRLQETCHRAWLEVLARGEEESCWFDTYRMTGSDVPVSCCFAFDAAKKSQLIKTKDIDAESCLKRSLESSELCGRAWVALYAYPEHKAHMDKTNIRANYRVYAPEPDNALLESIEVEIESHAETSMLDCMVATMAHEPMADQLKFCISAHASDMARAVPVLVNSLVKDNNVDLSQIYVVAGGFDREHTMNLDGIPVHCVTHNSYDHTALVEIVEKAVPGLWWFAMHATCKAGTQFVEKVLKRGFKNEHVAAILGGWLNMGLMSRSFIERNANYISSLKNCGKMQAILSEQLYWRMARTRDYYDYVGPHLHWGNLEVYKDGIERQVLYLSGCDLYKYQAYHIAQERTQRLLSEHVVLSSDFTLEHTQPPQVVSTPTKNNGRDSRT
ncbi:MAG: hypothetical protein JSS66_04910 [Armatimonadetes bacterium]|nr:hypothetical protein [Armatimonadota bacterium]